MAKHPTPKWDVQHHIAPDFYVETLRAHGVDIGGVPFPKWSLQDSLRVMDAWSIEKAILSTPTAHLEDVAAASDLVRRCNDVILDAVDRHPDRFGGFASLPLPDVDGSLAEYDRAVTHGGLDGVILMSNVDGRRPGHESHRPLFERLDADRAVVFVHPATHPDDLGDGLVNPMYGWFLDTTAALLSLLKAGFHRDYPHIRYVFAHGGGVVSQLAQELERTGSSLAAELTAWRDQLWFDTAKYVTEEAIDSLLTFTSPERLLFSTDFPWAAKNKIPYWVSEVDARFPDADTRAGVYREHARALFDKDTTPAPAVPAREARPHVPVHLDAVPRTLEHEVAAMGVDTSTVTWLDAAAVADLSEAERTLPVVLDLPALWELPTTGRAAFIARANEEVAALAKELDGAVQAYGAVDLSDAGTALAQINVCATDPHIVGLALFPSEVGTATVPANVIDAIAASGLPVLLHPRDGSGMMIDASDRLAAPHAMARLMYTGAIDALAGTHLTLTHSGGVHRTLADSMGLLFYLRERKWNMAGFMFDYVIRKRLRGEEILRAADWD